MSITVTTTGTVALFLVSLVSLILCVALAVLVSAGVTYSRPRARRGGAHRMTGTRSLPVADGNPAVDPGLTLPVPARCNDDTMSLVMPVDPWADADRYALAAA